MTLPGGCTRETLSINLNCLSSVNVVWEWWSPTNRFYASLDRVQNSAERGVGNGGYREGGNIFISSNWQRLLCLLYVVFIFLHLSGLSRRIRPWNTLQTSLHVLSLRIHPWNRLMTWCVLTCRVQPYQNLTDVQEQAS